MRDDGGTGPLTHVSGRMGSKDPVGISGCKAYLAVNCSPTNSQEIRSAHS